MTSRKVGSQIVPDRRVPVRMEPIQAAAEPFLKDLYSGIYKRAENDIDQMLRLLYDSSWREFSAEITVDIRTFADENIADEQRNDAAIKAWADSRGQFLEGEYSQSYYRVAVHVGLLAYVKHMAEIRARINVGAGWYRIIERFHDVCSCSTDYGFISATEKWGGLSLRYRCDSSSQDVVKSNEQIAVDQAWTVCEICGDWGELRRQNWRKVLCDEHWLERKVVYSEAEYDRLMSHFIDNRPRWQPIVRSWEDDGLSSDQIYADFLNTFDDLAPDVRDFWAGQCARWCLLTRSRAEGRSKDDGV